MALATESNVNSRFTDVFDEPVGHLRSPIRGYEDKPLVPFTETVKSIFGLVKNIQENVFVALHNCQNPADGLKYNAIAW